MKQNGESIIPETVFKTLIIRMLNEFRERIDELVRTYKKEIETIKNQLEIKSTITKMKITLNENKITHEIESTID